MRVIEAQVFMVYTYIISSAFECVGIQVKNKRSPLEHGHVEFENSFSKISNSFPAILDPSKANFKSSKKKLSPIKDFHHSHIRDEWIPGHVDHHSFIPGHIHHILLPSHAIIIHNSVVMSHGYEVPYRQHYGGFGVGLDTGGHGAGHGFHVWQAYTLDI